MRRLDRQLLAGNLWLYIVSLCSKGKVHAYALPSLIEARFGFKPSRIMCYIVVYRLKAEGLIAAAQAGRRVMYKSTPLGKNQLAQAKYKIKSLLARL